MAQDLSPQPHPIFTRFRARLGQAQAFARIRDGQIGKGAMIPGEAGPLPLVYADHVASGRALTQVEDLIRDEVLPFYANSHSETSYCGAFITGLRRAARAEIGRLCGAGPDHAVIFAGSGATAGINRLVALLGAGPGVRVVVGPYEHHSNLLPWRESGAEVVELPEAPSGGPDLTALEAALQAPGARRVICAMSAASNISGIVTDVGAVTARVKAAGALMVWDYAGAGPYLPIAMGQSDALVTSPHKFPGGPGASGVLILRRGAVVLDRPSWPGGGTVRFVSSTLQDYASDLEAREEAGTPNILGDIRAALAFLVKEAMGTDRIAARNAQLVAQGMAAWGQDPNLTLLGLHQAPRLPIFSLCLHPGGRALHQTTAARLLSARYGIQARSGCGCAGPYAHRLLGLDGAQSARIRAAILAGDDSARPGFLRLNLSVLMDQAEVDYILASVTALAADPKTA